METEPDGTDRSSATPSAAAACRRAARTRSAITLRWLVVLGAAATLASSCLTAKLWTVTDPTEYVAIPQSEVSASQLQDSGVRYRRDDEHGLYYVEKSGVRRFGDYTIRALAVPATVVLDTASVIVVVGAVAGAAVGVQELKRYDSGQRARESLGHQ